MTKIERVHSIAKKKNVLEYTLVEQEKVHKMVVGIEMRSFCKYHPHLIASISLNQPLSLFSHETKSKHS